MTGSPVLLLERIQEASFGRASAATRAAFPPANRMSGERLAVCLSSGTAVLASVRPDGRPHAAPVAFALVGTAIVVPSSSDAVRVENLRRRPHASLVVTRGEDEPREVVLVEGTARLVPVEDAALSHRAPFRDASGALPSWMRLFVTIAPERILSYAADAPA